MSTRRAPARVADEHGERRRESQFSTVVPTFYGRRMPLFLDETVATEPGSAPGPDPVVTLATGGQRSFDELGEPLREVTFVVVDLETTGGSAATDAITEIGAVKVRGGQVLGEFATLVDPGRSIPPQITMLTGITDTMVFDAPRIQGVLPMFLEFIRGSVLVAHNARFDVGFLRAACAGSSCPGRGRRWWTRCGWPGRCCPARRHRASGCPRSPSCSGPGPGRTIGRCTMPGPRSTCCTRCSSGWVPSVCTACPSCTTPPGTWHRSGGASAGWRTGCRPHPGSTCSAGRGRRCSTSGRPATCASGCVRTSPRPSNGPGSIRWSAWPSGSITSSVRTPWRRTSGSSG